MISLESEDDLSGAVNFFKFEFIGWPKSVNQCSLLGGKNDSPYAQRQAGV